MENYPAVFLQLLQAECDAFGQNISQVVCTSWLLKILKTLYTTSHRATLQIRPWEQATNKITWLHQRTNSLLPSSVPSPPSHSRIPTVCVPFRISLIEQQHDGPPKRRRLCSQLLQLAACNWRICDHPQLGWVAMLTGRDMNWIGSLDLARINEDQPGESSLALNPATFRVLLAPTKAMMVSTSGYCQWLKFQPHANLQ